MINNKARSFVTIMIVVALSALLLRLAVHKIIVYKIAFIAVVINKVVFFSC